MVKSRSPGRVRLWAPEACCFRCHVLLGNREQEGGSGEERKKIPGNVTASLGATQAGSQKAWYVVSTGGAKDRVSGQKLRTQVPTCDTVSSSQPDHFPLRRVLCTALTQRKVLDKREAVPSLK